jgi:hypothetical protein
MSETLRTGPMPGDIISSVNNEPVGSSLFPFIRSTRIFGQVVLPEDFHTTGETNGTRIRQTHVHYRNAEVVTGPNGVFWEDEFGNFFSTLTAKGGDAQNLRVIRTNRDDLGYFVWGLEDTWGLGRKIIASRILRQAGVDTEVIEVLFHPSKLPVDDTLYSTEPTETSLSPFATVLLAKAANNGTHETKTVFRGAYEANIKDVAGAFQYLQSVDFFVEYRGTLSPFSLQDLLLSKDRDDFMGKMRRLLTVVNLSEEIQFKRGNTQRAEYFDLTNASLFDYFCRYLPKRLAVNIARSHNKQIAFRAITPGNVEGNGGFKDLEYVVGKEFNDYMQGEIADDTTGAAIIISEFVGSLLEKGWLQIPYAENTDFQTMDGYRKLHHIRTMIKAQYDTVYFITREDNPEPYMKFDLGYEWYRLIEQLEFDLTQGTYMDQILFNAPDADALRKDILRAFTKTYDWDYRILDKQNMFDMEQLLTDFFDHLEDSMKGTVKRVRRSGFSPELAHKPKREALLDEFYSELCVSDEEENLRIYLLLAIQDKIMDSLKGIQYLNIKSSYLRVDEIKDALSQIYADREIEELFTILQNNGFVAMAVEEIRKFQTQLAEQYKDVVAP